MSATFGNRLSPTNFQVVSDMIAKIMCEHFGIPVVVYIDDFILLSPAGYAGIHHQLLLDLLNLFGFPISNKEDGKVLGKVGVPTDVLGLNYVTGLDGTIELKVPDAKLLTLKLEVDVLRNKNE